MKNMINKIIGVVVGIFLIFSIAGGLFVYHVYQTYGPLYEIMDYGDIDFKYIKIAHYETPVPDIKITGADVEKLIMDVPIIIWNPSIKDAKTLKVDFWVYMEGKPLTSGTVPPYKLPAQQDTTIWLTDVVIKYDELGDVLHVVAARHGVEMIKEGRANIAMTVDLVIYFPIEIFGIWINTFTIPYRIETELPVDMLKQKEDAERGIKEKIKEVLPAPIPVETFDRMHAQLNKVYIERSISLDAYRRRDYEIAKTKAYNARSYIEKAFLYYQDIQTGLTESEKIHWQTFFELRRLDNGLIINTIHWRIEADDIPKKIIDEQSLIEFELFVRRTEELGNAWRIYTDKLEYIQRTQPDFGITDAEIHFARERYVFFNKYVESGRIFINELKQRR